MSFWTRWAERERAGLAAQGRRRQVRDFDARCPAGRLGPGGTPAVSFASNDYLGLSAHPAVIAGARAALDRWGAGAGSARLIVGSRPVHSELETELARWKGTPSAVLFSTGYAANLGVLSAFGGPGVLICSDELNHASIVDGCRLSRARTAVYPHLDVGAVDRLLRNAPQGIVVTDTVFSMDGDTAPVDELTQVCRRHSALLVLDEAHAVLGPHPELREVDAIRIGTLSKFLGAMGGFAASSATFADHLINRARPFIFTTATSPADAGAALAAVQVLVSDEGARLKARLRRFVDRIRPGHPSPIVSIVLGSERAALDASARLLERGLLVPAIRPPSVRPGSSRLRVTLSAAHTGEQVDALTDALNEIRNVAADA
jgi:8-amino-7-oxononanoate synthase